MRLEADMKRLEVEYNMFFSGRLPKPPWETRARVAATIKRFDQAYIQNYGDRFRFSTLQARFAAFINLWDRGMRAREEGRAGPFGPKQNDAATDAKASGDRILHVAAFRDPLLETDKLKGLYESLVEARRDVGEDAVPFDTFANLVRDQVRKLKTDGHPEVAFRVAVKDGKVNFTARALATEPDDVE
jgi:hypothetical protein